MRNLLAGLMAALIVTTTASAAALLRLVEDGEPVATVVVPDDDRLAMNAARLLTKCVAEASGARLRVVPESRAPKGPKVYVGFTRATQMAVPDVKSLKGQSCILKAAGGHLYLAGRDVVCTPQRRRARYSVPASLRAVSIFLEDHMGVRFLWPNRKGYGRHVPKARTLSFPADLERRWDPTFVYVACSAWRVGDVYKLYTQFNASAAFQMYGGHSYYPAVPKAKYARTHPEYFAKIGGVRNSSLNHLCIGNIEVQDLIYAEILKHIDAGMEAAELGQTDGYQPCQCAKCRAIHPDPGERLWIVHDKLARRLARERPKAKVIIISYGPTVEPPQTIKRFGKNVIIEMCRYDAPHFAKWREKADAFMVYVYNWGAYHTMGFAPKTTPEMVARQLKFLRDSGVKAIYCCGNGDCWGMQGPMYYVFRKCLDDPDRDWRKDLDDFHHAAFGRAYVPMKAFYDSLYESLRLYGGLGRWPRLVEGEKAANMPFKPEAHFTYFFPPRLLKTLETCLARAKELEPTGPVRKRLDFVERSFLYVKDVATVFHLYRAYLTAPNWSTFDVLAAAIKQRDARVRSFYKRGGRLAQIEGFPPMFQRGDLNTALKGGGLRGILSSPFFWNVDLLKAKRILPGVGRKTIRVARAKGAVRLDGRLDEPVWKRAEVGEFVEIGMGKLTVQTRVRLAYDARNLYVAYECEEPLVDKLASPWWTSHGHDGRVFTQDCVETFIDPVGDQSQYYHFICSAKPKSTFDLAFGLHKDPLHPLFNKRDRAWNGKWSYGGRIDQPGKRWSVELAIPFATLNVKAPGKGSVWKMNLGRERFVHQTRHGDPQLFMWSPNLEERNFHSPAAFGDVVFD